MARQSRRCLSDAERDQRRQADRERLEQAARDLLSSDGWARWMRVRATNGLARYSLRNQWLIASECARRGITPTYVVAVALDRLARRRQRHRLHPGQHVGHRDVKHVHRAEEDLPLAGLLALGVALLDRQGGEDADRRLSLPHNCAMPALHRRQGAPITTTAKTSAGVHGRTPAWLLPDPRWEEQKARLWAMTVDERVRAVHAGELSMACACTRRAVGRPTFRSSTASSRSLRSTPPRSPTTADSASSSPSRSFAARPALHAASTTRAAAEAQHTARASRPPCGVGTLVRRVLDDVTVAIAGRIEPSSTTIATAGAYVVGVATTLPGRVVGPTSCYLGAFEGDTAVSHLHLGPGRRDRLAQRILPGEQPGLTRARACLLEHAGELQAALSDLTHEQVSVDVSPRALEQAAGAWAEPT
jgi:hypothetical protein